MDLSCAVYWQVHVAAFIWRARGLQENCEASLKAKKKPYEDKHWRIAS